MSSFFFLSLVRRTRAQSLLVPLVFCLYFFLMIKKSWKKTTMMGTSHVNSQQSIAAFAKLSWSITNDLKEMHLMIDYFYQLCWAHDAQSWLKSHCFSNLQPGNDQNQTTTTTTKHVCFIDLQEVASAQIEHAWDDGNVSWDARHTWNIWHIMLNTW